MDWSEVGEVKGSVWKGYMKRGGLKRKWDRQVGVKKWLLLIMKSVFGSGRFSYFVIKLSIHFCQQYSYIYIYIYIYICVCVCVVCVSWKEIR